MNIISEEIDDNEVLAWKKNSACLDVDINIFFPEDETIETATVDYAKSICYNCPVIDDCFEYIMSLSRNTEGIWAGTTNQERKRMKRYRIEVREKLIQRHVDARPKPTITINKPSAKRIEE